MPPQNTSSPKPGVPELRYSRLARGVNLSHWYAQWKTYDESHLSTYFTQDDVKLVADMGFTHVRLTLDDSVVWTQAGELIAENVARFRTRLQWFMDAKVAVIVDLHPSTSYRDTILADSATADGFVAGWGRLAGALTDTDPDWVFFEVMNEPAPNKGYLWWTLQDHAVRSIRANAPLHTIIVSPGDYSGINTLLDFEPYRDRNLVYTVHHYETLAFTHQSAGWAPKVIERIANLSWPIDPGDAERAAAAATSDPEAYRLVKWQIEAGFFTESWLVRQFNLVEDWTRRFPDERIYVGEFGVYTKSAPRDARIRWYGFCSAEFKRRGWPWAIWDYAGGFAVTQRQGGKRTADRELLAAMGMSRNG